MNSKKYCFLSILIALPLILSGCGGGHRDRSSSRSSQTTSSSGGGSGAVVTGVTISRPDETMMLDGTSITLRATVSTEQGTSKRVRWSSSNVSAASVNDGVVRFLRVTEDRQVTITATSIDDPNYSDSIEFTVVHSPFDLSKSRGNPYTGSYFDDGSFIIENNGDSALIYSDVYDTRWYVEATIQIDSFNPNDLYPKVGIMASSRDDGYWCTENSRQLFYYVDSYSSANSWNSLNVVMENNTFDNWDWANPLSPALSTSAIRKNRPFKLGLMRDGNQFYQFYGREEDASLNLVGSFKYNSFNNKENYVWIGGWDVNYTVSNLAFSTGSEVDSLYTVPANLSLNSTEKFLYFGDTYQIEVNASGLWNRNKLTFSSSNPAIASVDSKGLVRANNDTAGDAIITVRLQETSLSAQFTVHVTDDTNRITIDGEMNEAIWSDKIKANSYLLKKNGTNYIKLYGTKTFEGLFIYVDYVVSQLANNETNAWWTWDNVEFRFADDSKQWSGQYYMSAMNGGLFVSVGDGEKQEQGCYKSPTMGEDDLYHSAFEMFIPYGDDKITQNQTTYVCFGFNAKVGWQASYNWMVSPIPSTTLNITSDGLVHDNTSCYDGGHLYGDWIIDVAPTCNSTGSAHRECSICGHQETKVLPIDSNAHVFDYEHAEVSVAPTCSSTGIGVATCTVCGATKEVVLPRDPTNHSDPDFPDTHDHCEGCGASASGEIVVDHNFGGWSDKSTWYDLGVISGNFIVELEFTMFGCQGCTTESQPGDCCWRTVLPILYGLEWTPNNAVDQVFRMDWFGWTEGGFATSSNNGVCPSGFDWNINYEAFSNMDIKLTITKSGKNVTLDWIWICNATEGYYQGKTFEFHQSCVLADNYSSSIGVALTGEWVILSITKSLVTLI